MNKTKEQLIEEIEALSRRVAELEKSEAERKWAVETLRLSETEKETILDAMSDIVLFHDSNLSIQWGNEAAARSVGKTRQELVGCHCYELWHGRSEPCEGCPVLRALETKSYAMSIMRTPEGRWWEIIGEPVCDKDEKMRGAIEIAHDITERKQIEERLRESEAQMQALLDGSPDMIRQLDGDMRIVWANKTALDVNPDAVGQTCYKAYLDRDEPCKGCPCKKAMDTGQIEMSVMYQPWTRATRGESYWENIGVPLRDSEGKVVGVVEIVRNVTERKRAEEALRESEERYHHLFDGLNDAAFLADVETGIIIETNQQGTTLLGRSRDEIVGMHQSQLHPPGKADEYRQRFDTHIRKGHAADYDGEVIRKDETIVPVTISASTLTIGEQHLILGLFRDITKRKQMDEQLIVTDRLASIGELASGIAHELNNPLTGVIGFSQLLLDKDVSDDVKEDLRIIYSEAQRAAQVVKGLLTFARRHPPVKQLVNINTIIEKVLELRAYEQRVSNIQVKTRFAPDPPEVMADHFQLQQVFLNIIINAEYFMIEAHGKGTLTIATEKVGDIIKASFTDDGPGISREDLVHVFDPFFTTKEVGQGTGLGLSICHGIITEHGGRIYVESELGKGATFIVELPITDH